MDRFYIDRQFGIAIWIDVENGIVQKIYNGEDNFIAKMNENYQGKSITFLKEDFIERAMEGTVHILQCDSVVKYKQYVHALKSRIRNVNGLIQMNLKTTLPKREDEKSWEKLNGELKRLEALRDNYTIEMSQAERTLDAQKERVLTEHNFKS